MSNEPKNPEKRVKVKTTPFFRTRREKKTFRIDHKKAWNTYWENVWNKGKMKVRNPNQRTRKKYPMVSVGHMFHQDLAFRSRIHQHYEKWKEMNIEGPLISQSPHGLHKGSLIHLEAQKVNPEVSDLHKGDRYYGIVEDVDTGKFTVQLYDVRNGNPLRKFTIPRAKFEEYEARYHPDVDDPKSRIQASVADRWLLDQARA